ncbi:MAG: VTT domain-containing protein [Syntrophobacterales bacterium]|jgi:uncharacterized membrane protein YdjX (TVP38/TMEM64 family)|nr:VTT domain-containing protein [Syntrophobacterales bacterium]
MKPLNPINSPETGAAAPEAESFLSEMGAWLGARPGMADRAEYLFFLSASLIFLLGILALVGYIYLDPVRERLYEAVLNRDRLRAVIDRTGSWGPLLFILVQAVQVILPFWSVPMEIAGGFLFGLPLGLLYSMAGRTLGALLAFMLARWLEKRFVVRLVSAGRLKRFRKVMKQGGSLAAFFFLLIPGIPKDFIYYLLGLTRMSVIFFLVATALARFPGTLLFTLEGAEVYKGHYSVILGLLALYVGLAFLLYRHRESLYRWVSRWYPEED